MSPDVYSRDEFQWQKLKTKNKHMKKIRLGTNFAVFILFFGVAMLEAFQSHNWLKSIFWLVIGIVFLVADNLGKKGA
jgi:hypothetical protein